MSVHEKPLTHEASTKSQAAPAWDEIRSLPPSAKLVAKVLAHHGTLSQRELADETLLSPRTVRQAVARLETHDAIETRVSFRDARKKLYSLQL